MFRLGEFARRRRKWAWLRKFLKLCAASALQQEKLMAECQVLSVQSGPI
jgi:hypothetical protein